MLKMFENYANPNEETSLLGKFRRRINTNSTSSVIRDTFVGEINMVPTRYQFKWQKIRFFLVEPMVLILVFSYNLSATVLKNKIMVQTCTFVFNHNITDCQILSTKNSSEYIKNIEDEVQQYVTRIFMSTSVIQSIVPAFCASFVGAWSDRFGRKPLLIASFTGFFLFYAITSIISYFSDMMNISPWYYLLSSIPLSLLGDSVTYSVATLCYISDVSTAEARPYRMVLYEAVIYIGLMTGSFTSGYIYRDYSSSTLIFSISACCLLFATLIIIFLIPESLYFHSESNTILANNNVQNEIMDVNGRSKTIFDCKLIEKMYKTCFQYRAFEARSIVLTIVTILVICAFVVEGSGNVFYLFIREKFQWTIREYTIFETFSILVPIFGNIFGFFLLRKILKIPLLNLATLGLLSQTCNYFMKGFAATNLQLYLGILLGVLKSIVNPILRTLLSKIMPANELGKIFSFISAVEAFIPFVASPLYMIVYNFTLKSYPGFFNVLSANIYLMTIILILIVFRKKNKYPDYYCDILN